MPADRIRKARAAGVRVLQIMESGSRPKIREVYPENDGTHVAAQASHRNSIQLMPRTARKIHPSIPGARAAAPPDFVPPELATLVGEVPEDAGWVHELK